MLSAVECVKLLALTYVSYFKKWHVAHQNRVTGTSTMEPREFLMFMGILLSGKLGVGYWQIDRATLFF